MQKLIVTAAMTAFLSAPALAADKDKAEWLFVQSAQNAEVLGDDVLAVPMEREIFAFTDRPERRHAHLNAHEFVMGWDEGENSFREDPPNVVITWVENGEVERVEAVFTDASVQDHGRSIHYVVTGASLNGLPERMNDVSIFVDGSCIPNGMGACGYQADAGPGGLF